MSTHVNLTEDCWECGGSGGFMTISEPIVRWVACSRCGGSGCLDSRLEQRRRRDEQLECAARHRKQAEDHLRQAAYHEERARIYESTPELAKEAKR